MYLGVDGGGTKTAFALLDAAGRVLGTADGPSTAPALGEHGMQTAQAVLRSGITEVCAQGGHRAHASDSRVLRTARPWGVPVPVRRVGLTARADPRAQPVRRGQRHDVRLGRIARPRGRHQRDQWDGFAGLWRPARAGSAHRRLGRASATRDERTSCVTACTTCSGSSPPSPGCPSRRRRRCTRGSATSRSSTTSGTTAKTPGPSCARGWSVNAPRPPTRPTSARSGRTARRGTTNPFSWEFFRTYGAYPAANDRQVVEFFPEPEPEPEPERWALGGRRLLRQEAGRRRLLRTGDPRVGRGALPVDAHPGRGGRAAGRVRSRPLHRGARATPRDHPVDHVRPVGDVLGERAQPGQRTGPARPGGPGDSGCGHRAGTASAAGPGPVRRHPGLLRAGRSTQARRRAPHWCACPSPLDARETRRRTTLGPVNAQGPGSQER